MAADLRALLLALLLVLPLPCLGADLAGSVTAALDKAREHLAAPLDEIGLPGQRERQTSSPGSRLIRCNLAEAARAVATDCEQLFSAGSVDSLLRVAGVDSPPGLPSNSSGMRFSFTDSLHKHVPGGIETLALLDGANRELRRAFALLSFAERAELRKRVRGFEFWRDQWPGYPVGRMLELAERVERQPLAAAGALLALCAHTIRESVLSSALTFDKQLTYQTPLGAVVIGTYGDDTYRAQGALLIIDPGGDDSYHLPVAGWPVVSMIVDLGGDDYYSCPDGAGLGGAVMGASWLEDISGSDTYSAGPFSQGCGVFGIGVLIDRQGDDRYRGEYLCQGASFFGIGALIDMGGDDIYGADFGAQGASFAAGSALLADLGGR